MSAIWNVLFFVSLILKIQAKNDTNFNLEEEFRMMVRQQKNMAQQQKIMETKIEQLEYKLSSCNDVITTGKRLLENNVEEHTTKIAFDAILTHDWDHPTNADTILVFDQVLTNIGNAYKNDVGIFTAPVKGVYLFTYTIHADYAAALFGSLTVDGRKMSTITVDGSGNPIFISSASRTILVSLNMSDRAYIQTWTAGRGVVKSNNYGHTAFAGTLLFTTS